MVRSVNVKKTKSSKKIVLKITMSMTPTHFSNHSYISSHNELGCFDHSHRFIQNPTLHLSDVWSQAVLDTW